MLLQPYFMQYIGLLHQEPGLKRKRQNKYLPRLKQGFYIGPTWTETNFLQLLLQKTVACQISQKFFNKFLKWNVQTDRNAFIYVLYSKSFYLFPERDSDSRPQRELKHSLLPAKIDCVCLGHMQSSWAESQTSPLIRCLMLNDLLRSLYSRLIGP